MIDERKTLFTGGNGLLGSEFKKRLKNAFYPVREEFDVTNYIQMSEYIKTKSIDLIIHAAAFISPPKIDANPEKAVETNIIGTANVVKLCMDNNIKLVYISTDYVFRGDKGNYKEEDELYPVNKYAWSKLGGECAVRLYDNSLIIRTTFGPNVFPYEKAFVDQWTSRESVSKICELMIKVIDSNTSGVIHIGGKRKTVFEYAKSLDDKKDIKELYANEVNFKVPKDTSMNIDKLKDIIKE